MYNIRPLSKTKDLQRILFNQKKNKRSFSVLFVSLWDPASQALMERLYDEYQEDSKGEPLYIVDSFEMPDSFTEFSTNKVPQLVQVRKDFTSEDDYLPIVYKKLRFSNRNS